MPYCMGTLERANNFNDDYECSRCFASVKRCTCGVFNRLDASYCRSCGSLLRSSQDYDQSHFDIHWKYTKLNQESYNISLPVRERACLENNESRVFSPFRVSDGILFPSESGFSLHKVIEPGKSTFSNKMKEGEVQRSASGYRLELLWDVELGAFATQANTPVKIKNFLYFIVDEGNELAIYSLMITSGRKKEIARFSVNTQLVDDQSPTVHKFATRHDEYYSVFWAVNGGFVVLRVSDVSTQAQHVPLLRKASDLPNQVPFFSGCLTEKYIYFLSQKGALFRVEPSISFELLRIVQIPPVEAPINVAVCSALETVNNVDGKNIGVAWLSRTQGNQNQAQVSVNFRPDEGLPCSAPLDVKQEPEYFNQQYLPPLFNISTELFAFSYHAGLYRINLIEEQPSQMVSKGFTLTTEHHENERELTAQSVLTGANLSVIFKDEILYTLSIDQAEGYAISGQNRMEYEPLARPTVFGNEVMAVSPDRIHILPLG